MEERIASYLEKTFLFQFGQEVPREADLFRVGVLDSQGYISLLKFLEEEFGILFSDEEILSNVMTTLSALTACVTSKLEAARQG